MEIMRIFLLFIVAVNFFLTGCSTTFSDDPSLWVYDKGSAPSPNTHVKIKGLGPCTDNPDRTLHLNSQSPTTILTHGCFASSGRFRALAEVFAFHGQQTACFTYDDRDSMMLSSKQLIEAIHELGKVMENKKITVIGHSQGGLISHKALIKDREKSLLKDKLDLRLATISSPFSGISAASHCGSTMARVLTLGLIVPICYAVSGDKWYEITAASDFIRQPGELVPQVTDFLKIVTDERDTCRQRDDDGACIEDDYVFSVSEQYFDNIDKDKRVTNVELHAGHVEIVGDHHTAPRKLISILQQHGLMNSTTAQQQKTFEIMLGRVYGLVH